MYRLLYTSAAAATLLAATMLPANATTYGPPTPSAFPIHPFQASLFLTPNTGAATGAGAEIGVTSITLANQGSTSAQVDIFQASTSQASPPATSSASC